MIAPGAEAGRDVVCDRFIDSTVAYQGARRGLGVELVERLNAARRRRLRARPDLLLRVDPELGRGARQGAEDDRFELEGIEFQRAVAAAYDELAARHRADRGGGRRRRVEEVHARVMAAVSRVR